MTPAPRPPRVPQAPDGTGRDERGLPDPPKPSEGRSEARLTMPSYDHGACHIIVDRRKVGFALATFHDWEAYLFPVADTRPATTDETVRAPRLRALRALLRDRFAEQGPWWTEPEGDPDAR